MTIALIQVDKVCEVSGAIFFSKDQVNYVLRVDLLFVRDMGLNVYMLITYSDLCTLCC